MSKTIKKCFNEKLTFEKLLEAHKRASKVKNNSCEVIKFNIDLETNIINLLNDIKNDNYKQGKYREFMVYEPKKRLIKSLPYRDRIVQQWYIEEFIKPFFLKRFIIDNYACIENKGTHKAVYKLQDYMKKYQKKENNYYILKCDVKKFFYNIDKEILFDILEKRIADKKLNKFTKKIIYSDSDRIGIPIGNYSSQFFANIYLNELDHYVKEKLKITHYIRYMDDFVFLLPDKKTAKEIKNKVSDFLEKKLHLSLNDKSNYFPNKLGVDFCGYKIYNTHILLRKRFKIKCKKNTAIWNKLYLINRLNYEKMMRSFNSTKAHASHANSFNYMSNLKNKIIAFQNHEEIDDK